MGNSAGRFFGVLFAGVLLLGCSDTQDRRSVEATTTTSATSTTTTTQVTTTRQVTTTTQQPAVQVEGEIERAATRIIPHRAEYRGGKFYMEGSVPSRKTADQLKARAAEVIGAENVVDNYVIDPAAPPITDGRVIVDEPFLFPTGSAAINPGYQSLLNLGVAVMQLNPKVVMVIVGFTDSEGAEDMNLRLSLARAQAVKDWITARGIDPSRFELTGKGEAEPVGDNATPEGRALNRRIEVQLIHLLA
jgi:outer membrane protein OmpA-like peptidoglycan-associated protein